MLFPVFGISHLAYLRLGLSPELPGFNAGNEKKISEVADTEYRKHQNPIAAKRWIFGDSVCIRPLYPLVMAI